MQNINNEEDDDAFDANGILKDGRSFRVSLHLLDSAQRAVHDHVGELAKVHVLDLSLHQPGFVTEGHRPVADRRADREAMYSHYDAELSERWKSPVTEAGGHGLGGQEHRPRSGRQADTKDAREAAYSDYLDYVTEAWRGAGR